VVSSPDTQAGGPGFEYRKRSTCQWLTKLAILSGSISWNQFRLRLKNPCLYSTWWVWHKARYKCALRWAFSAPISWISQEHGVQVNIIDKPHIIIPESLKSRLPGTYNQMAKSKNRNNAILSTHAPYNRLENVLSRTKPAPYLQRLRRLVSLIYAYELSQRTGATSLLKLNVSSMHE